MVHDHPTRGLITGGSWVTIIDSKRCGQDVSHCRLVVARILNTVLSVYRLAGSAGELAPVVPGIPNLPRLENHVMAFDRVMARGGKWKNSASLALAWEITDT